MAEDVPFDLSQFLGDSLRLSDSCATPCRPLDPSRVQDHRLKLFGQDPAQVLGLGIADPPMNRSDDAEGTPIQEFYKGLNIFITGGTGFIGKTLIQKMIRSIPQLGQIYVLIRPKRGKSPKERFDQLFEDYLFTRMKAEVPDYNSLLTAVEGDIAEEGLGLSTADRQLLMDNVHVVFHSAADVRFVEPLRAAFASNVLGTKGVIDLSRQMKKLKSFVHVSTAYSQCVRTVIKELVPKMSINYRDIAHILEERTDEEIQNDLTRILQGWPNTYTFSKALCEDMIVEEAKDLPICIFRPAIVATTYQDPIRGWTDNLYGPNGLMLGAMLGILHTFVADTGVSMDIVPVDFTVNFMIAVAWHTASVSCRNADDISVYNFAYTGTNPSPWKMGVDAASYYMDIWPFDQSIWYPSFIPTQSSTLDAIVHPFVHTLPGKVLDKVASLSGLPPRLSKIYDRIKPLKSALSYFAKNDWIFESNKVFDLWRSLTPRDKKLFNFDLREVDIIEHLMVSKLAVRYFILNQKMDSSPASMKRHQCLKVAHMCLKTVSALLVLKLFVCIAHLLPI